MADSSSMVLWVEAAPIGEAFDSALIASAERDALPAIEAEPQAPACLQHAIARESAFASGERVVAASDDRAPAPVSTNSALAPISPACAAGLVLGGKYCLERLLAEGGMGNVWLARNELLELPVAIKVARPEVRALGAGARLLTEARVQANLSHPNVARVFDYGVSTGGDAYIVMELLDGCSLADWLEQRGGLAPAFAVELLLPIIDALSAAHRAGVVHRDLKPDNIFIARSGSQLCPKLLDFGIARRQDEFQPRLTERGRVLGSPAYMAPEQAYGLDDVDQRADVWAACLVLYEAISGKPAFDADNYNALLRVVIERELAPLTVAGCEQLWPILRAGLVKDRAERTANMHELGSALARWLGAQGEREGTCLEPMAWRWQPWSIGDSQPPQAPALPLAQPAAVPASDGASERAALQPGAAHRRVGVPPRLGSLTVRLRRPGARQPAVPRVVLAACLGASVLALAVAGRAGVGASEDRAGVDSPAASAAGPDGAREPRDAWELRLPPERLDATPLQLSAAAPERELGSVAGADACPDEAPGRADAVPPATELASLGGVMACRGDGPVRHARGRPSALQSELSGQPLVASGATLRRMGSDAPAVAEAAVKPSARVKPREQASEEELGLKNPW